MPIFAAAGRKNIYHYLRARTSQGISGRVNERKLGIQEREAASVCKHPQYDQNHAKDLALLRLEEPFIIGPKVQSVPIADGKAHTPISILISK